MTAERDEALKKARLLHVDLQKQALRAAASEIAKEQRALKLFKRSQSSKLKQLKKDLAQKRKIEDDKATKDRKKLLRPQSLTI